MSKANVFDKIREATIMDDITIAEKALDEYAREMSIGAMHWKEKVFKESYNGYILKDYKSVKEYPGLLFGEHYSISDIYTKYFETLNKKV